jgi:hypothetical protein
MKFYFRVVAFAFLTGTLIFLSCRPRDNSSDSSAAKSVDDSNAPYSYSDYMRDCEAQLGKIPAYSCLDGVEIPIHNTETGKVTFENHKGIDQQCDAPTHIRSDAAAWAIDANHCVPGTRMGRLQPAKGFEDKVQIVFICRKYFDRKHMAERDDKGMVKFSQKIIFDDTNVIAHNTETGATCFFVNHINRTDPTYIKGENGFDGRQIPRIGSPEGQKFWSSPEEMKVTANFLGVQACTECHDNDPFIHIPYNHNVKFKDGSRVLPEDPFGPYKLVGGWFFHREEGTVTSQKAWAKLKHLVSKEASACTSCHRIGSGATCSTFLDISIGKEISKFTTKSLQGKTWMPPDAEHWEFRKWNADQVAELNNTVNFIRNCCQNPQARGCVWENLPGSPTVL